MSAPDETVAHHISVAIWDLASPVVAGRRATFKVGVSCSCGCDLHDTRIDVRDETQTISGTGVLGPEPWPGTRALYWTELDVPAPDATGDHAWTIHATPANVAPSNTTPPNTTSPDVTPRHTTPPDSTSPDATSPYATSSDGTPRYVVSGFPPPPKAPARLAEARAAREGGSRTDESVVSRTDSRAASITHEPVRSTVRIVVVRPPQHRVTCAVTEKGSGAPVAGVELRLGPFRGTTDERGVAYVDVGRGSYSVLAWKNGFDMLFRTVHVTADTRLSLEIAATPKREQPYWM